MSLAVPLAMDKRAGDGKCQLQTGGAIREDQRHVPRLRAPDLRQEGGAGHALDQVVVRRSPRVGAALAEAESSHINDARIDAANVLVRQPQARHGLRMQIAHEHVGGLA